MIRFVLSEFRYLILGNYLRAIRDMEPQLRAIHVPSIEIPPDLEILNEKLDPGEAKRLDPGIPPQLENTDFVPAQVHIGHPLLR